MPHKSHGRNIPYFERVRSAIMPISGSVAISINREIKNMVPAAPTPIPNTSV